MAKKLVIKVSNGDDIVLGLAPGTTLNHGAYFNNNYDAFFNTWKSYYGGTEATNLWKLVRTLAPNDSSDVTLNTGNNTNIRIYHPSGYASGLRRLDFRIGTTVSFKFESFSPPVAGSDLWYGALYLLTDDVTQVGTDAWDSMVYASFSHVNNNTSYQASSATQMSTPTNVKTWLNTATTGYQYDFPGTPSGTGGGIGNFDLASDAIDFPNLPSTGAVSSGFVSLYYPTEAELDKVQRYLWTTDMKQAWEAIFKFISDPMDMVIGLNMFPFTIPSTRHTSTKQVIEAGILDIQDPDDIGSKVKAYKLTSQYIELDAGYIDVGQFYGTSLDFQPYTKATIHVPFCGDYPLNIDDIRSNIDASVNGKRLQLKYHVDMFSGACVAMLKVGDAVLYQWTGSMAMNVPLTGSDYSNTIQNVISTATTIGMAASGAGAAAGAAKSAEGTAKAAAKESSAAAAKDSAIAELMGASTTVASALKPQIQRAGSVAGSAGFLGVQSPYIVFEIPRQSIAADYAKYTGFPCNVSYTLSDLVGKGFTVVSDMHLEGIRTGSSNDTYRAGATDAEIGEIEKLLNGGVIL